MIDRRTFGKGLAATTTVLSAPLIFPSSGRAQSFTNDPRRSSQAEIGIMIAETGPYADEGLELLRGYLLAAEHVNGDGDGGVLSSFSSKALDGNGVLGKKISVVTGDTQTKSDAARASAKSLIEKDNVISIMGSSTSGAALATLDIAQQAGVIMMAGNPTTLEFTGARRSRFGFRHFRNEFISTRLLIQSLAAVFGRDRRVATVSFGRVGDAGHLASQAQNVGWEIGAQLNPGFFAPPQQVVANIVNSGVDTVLTNASGGILARLNQTLLSFGLFDRQINGKNLVFGAPNGSSGFFSSLQNSYIGLNWHWDNEELGSFEFTKSFGSKYGYPPSQDAHTAYTQMLLYADAVARAETFRPEGVFEALEGFEYSGTGNGQALYNGGDHQTYQTTYAAKVETGGKLAFLPPIDQPECRCPSLGGSDTCLLQYCSDEYQET
ncbi:ABC transporter substrate-binding protein [Thalassococcus lentus]|uniref:ABC transporter substrate-binding protein n=1 Tax=Thalassococcus lentus TaxID=1210524 RepID=A0ABT4XUX9_9RHOB|nr:ABC transporter substrate-binding protein [Thalassococcus lentus]MDA7425697.1 ABC transporter substrate-binding protein [Thalassococcus lentus]